MWEEEKIFHCGGRKRISVTVREKRISVTVGVGREDLSLWGRGGGKRITDTVGGGKENLKMLGTMYGEAENCVSMEGD